MAIGTITVNGMTQALGWALIHFIWQGALIGLLFAAGNALLRRSAPNWRYGFGLACLVTLAATPILTFLSLLPTVTTNGWLAGPGSLPVVDAVVLVPAGVDWAEWVDRWMPGVVGIWMLGVALHAFRVWINWGRMRRLTRIGTREVPAELRERAQHLAELLGVTRAIAVFESTIVQVPTVLGWFKPVILLPTSTLIGLTPRQIELVIAHELGHVRRWDYLVNLLQVGIETALFYHPVVNWISRSVREEREKCCDDLVIRHCGNELEYAKALHNLESIRSGSLTPALAATDGKLFERIERIVATRRSDPGEAAVGNMLFLVLLGIAVVAAGRFADPMRALELRRAALADVLVNELLLATVPMHSQALLAPLENARLALNSRPSDPVATAVATADSTDAEADGKTRRERIPTSGLSADLPVPATPAAEPVQRESALPPPRQASAPEVVLFNPVEVTAERIEMNTAALSSPPRPRATLSTGPVILEKVAPDYPVRARLGGQTGFVELSFLIDIDGQPTDIEIVEAHPKRVFEKSSLRAIRKWRFDRSSMGSGVGRITQRFDFNLEGAAPLMLGAGRECQPITGTRICRTESPTFLKTLEAASP